MGLYNSKHFFEEATIICQMNGVESERPLLLQLLGLQAPVLMRLPLYHQQGLAGRGREAKSSIPFLIPRLDMILRNCCATRHRDHIRWHGAGAILLAAMAPGGIAGPMRVLGSELYFLEGRSGLEGEFLTFEG